MPKTPFSIDLIGEFSLTASKASFVREGKVYFQLRDRFGRWVEMGKSVKFKIRLKNGKYHSVLGTYSGQGHSDGVRGLITVENDAYLPNGNYPVASGNLQQYTALLSEQELKDQGIELGKDVSGATVTAREDSVIPNIDDIIGEAEDLSTPTKELRTEITGNEIQDIKIASIAKALKAEGRFPVPRQTTLDNWGKTSDVTKGAKLDYSKVYEGMSSEDPEFAEKYPTFDSFWDRVYDLAVDERTQSPDKLNEEMKKINKGYAKYVMGLDPENGTFTVYRNAINNAFEEKDAAVGYVSTSENLAFDYNANTRVGEQANGRYEITVKPDEVNGMIGYSQVEDEYALTIGPNVTYQEGRVKKVGELETVKVAPWHEEAVGKLKRGQGATPFRGHSFVGQFDFLPISKNPLQGDSLQDFLDDNNITMDDWKNKFDELHGEGAYQRFKDSGRENQVSLQSLQRMFVDLEDGTYGLDITKLSRAGDDSAGNASYGDFQNPSSYVNDYVDNKLKFLSLIQEITGEPFMIHKSHSKSDPRLEDKVEIKQPKQTGIFQEYDPEQRTTEDSNAAEDTPLTDLGFDPEAEITVYRGVPEGVDEINAGDWVSALPQLAKDYAGTGNVISMKVKAKDLLTDPSSGEGAYTEEMVYRPTTAKKPRTVSELPEIVNIEKTEVDDVKIEELYKPTDGEDFAAYEYQGSNYTVINKFSRVNPDYTFESRENFDPQTNSYIIDNIDKIDRAINAYKITEEVEVYRGASVTKEKFDELYANLDVGDLNIDSAYLSTSTDPSIGVKFAVRKLITDKDRIPVLFKAKLLPGQRALRVKELTQTDSLEENELLLPRNSKFKVTKVSKLTQGSSSGLNIELGSDDTDAFNDVKEILVFEGEYVQDTALEQPEPDTSSAVKTIDDIPLNTELYKNDRYRPSSEIIINVDSEDGELEPNENWAIDKYMGGDYLEVNASANAHPDLTGEQMLESVDPETIEAVSSWTGESYNIDTTTPFEIIKELDSAFKKSSLVNDEVVYRGVHASPESHQKFLNLKSDDIIIENGYLSTSTNLERATNYANRVEGAGGNLSPIEGHSPVLYRIQALKGTSAYENPEQSRGFGGEDELLLARNTKFKVVNVSKTSKGMLVIDLQTDPASGGALKESSQADVVGLNVSDAIEPQRETLGFVINPPPWSEEDARNYGRDRNPIWHIDSNGYQYTPTDYGTYIRINVWSPEAGEYVGWFEFRKVDGEIMEVNVEEEHRRKGIATNSLGVARVYAEDSGLPAVVHSDDRTPEGEAWAKSTGDELPTNIKDIPEEYEKWKNLADYLNDPEPTPIVTDGTSTITDRKGNTVSPGGEVNISYSIYEVGKGSRNAEKPLKAIFTGYKESDFSAGKGIETKNRAILYVPEQDGTVSGYYGVNSYVLNADPNSDDFKGVGGTSPVDIDGFSEKNALPNPKQMTSLSEQEAEEVIDYTSHKGSSEEINSSLRNDSVSPETQEKIDVLDKIIGYNQILEDQEYYRGVPIPLGLTLKEFLNNLDSGAITELEELGFSSTSTDEEMASIFANKYFGGGVVLRIKAKAGQSAYYVPKFLAGVVANENEVILPRGIKYRIVSHEFSPQDDKVFLDVEIGQPEPQAQDTDVSDIIEPGLDNWMPSLFDLLDSLEEDEDGEEITNDERGNILQSKFIEAAGFNGKPNLVTQEEFDAINSETLYRAVSDEKFIDNYINSETQFAGEGTSGNGTYTTNKRQTAEGFAGDTANKKELIDKRLMEIKLASDANILYLERTSDWRAWIEENKEILLEKAKQFGANPRNIQSIESKLTSTTDWSNYAIMLGYDGFKVSAGNNEYYTIILNRGKAIVNGKNLYFNPADGKWYKDSAFTIPLAQVDLN